MDTVISSVNVYAFLYFTSRFKNKEVCDQFKAIFEAAAEAEMNKTNGDDEEDEQQDSETESNNGYWTKDNGNFDELKTIHHR